MGLLGRTGGPWQRACFPCQYLGGLNRKPQTSTYTGHDSRMASIPSTHTAFMDTCVDLFSIIVGDDTVGISRVFISSILPLFLPSPGSWAQSARHLRHCIYLPFVLRPCYVIFCCFSPWPSLQGRFRSCRLWRTPDPGSERLKHHRSPILARFSLHQGSLLSKRV